MDKGDTNGIVNVSFPLEQVDGWPPVKFEEIPCNPIAEGQYRLRGIPFYARAVARDDVVKASPRNGKLEFIEVCDRAEAATVRAIVYDVTSVPAVRKTLGFLGCDTATNDLGKLVAIHVPSFVPYAPIRDYLENQAKGGVLGYEASCLMHTV
jgi:hypothetical protein